MLTVLVEKALSRRVASIPNQLVKGWLDRNDPTARLQRAWSEELEAWTLERLLALEAQCRRLNEQLAANPAREAALAALLEERQFGRLHRNFELEGVRETMDERRRMLAHASAGAFTVDMSLAETAHAERTLRELDPEAVVLLRSILGDARAKLVESRNQMRLAYGERGAASVPEDERRLHVEPQPYQLLAHFDAVVTSGCVRVEQVEHGMHMIQRSDGMRHVVKGIGYDESLVVPRLVTLARVTTSGVQVTKLLQGYEPSEV